MISGMPQSATQAGERRPQSTFRFHRWLANPSVLAIEEIKSVPYAPVSHPFVARLRWVPALRCFIAATKQDDEKLSTRTRTAFCFTQIPLRESLPLILAQPLARSLSPLGNDRFVRKRP
jgi:hypothetical protein